MSIYKSIRNAIAGATIASLAVAGYGYGQEVLKPKKIKEYPITAVSDTLSLIKSTPEGFERVYFKHKVRIYDYNKYEAYNPPSNDIVTDIDKDGLPEVHKIFNIKNKYGEEIGKIDIAYEVLDPELMRKWYDHERDFINAYVTYNMKDIKKYTKKEFEVFIKVKGFNGYDVNATLYVPTGKADNVSPNPIKQYKERKEFYINLSKLVKDEWDKENILSNIDKHVEDDMIKEEINIKKENYSKATITGKRKYTFDAPFYAGVEVTWKNKKNPSDKGNVISGIFYEEREYLYEKLSLGGALADVYKLPPLYEKGNYEPIKNLIIEYEVNSGIGDTTCEINLFNEKIELKKKIEVTLKEDSKKKVIVKDVYSLINQPLSKEKQNIYFGIMCYDKYSEKLNKLTYEELKKEGKEILDAYGRVYVVGKSTYNEAGSKVVGLRLKQITYDVYKGFFVGNMRLPANIQQVYKFLKNKPFKDLNDEQIKIILSSIFPEEDVKKYIK